MTYSLIAACLWVVAAMIISLFPSKKHHWPAAYWLTAIGIPLLGWVTYENGPLAGVICFAAGASVLRYPLLYLGRWIRGKIGMSGNR